MAARRNANMNTAGGIMASDGAPADGAAHLRDQLVRALGAAPIPTGEEIDRMRRSLLAAAISLLEAPQADPVLATRVAMHALAEWYDSRS
jgi:hypothetical protein